MSRAALAKLLGLSIGTVGLYPARSSPTTVPADATLALTRAELVRRARQMFEGAEIRAEIERELAVGF